MNSYEWYESYGIKLIVNDPVVSVNRENNEIVTEKGKHLNYDICIFATGSSAFVLPIPGAQFNSVIGWRTIEDTERMIEIAQTKKHAIVIGGGLLGLECARGLMDQGMDVTVIHLAKWLMEMQLDKKAGELLKADLEKQGMHFRMQASDKHVYAVGECAEHKGKTYGLVAPLYEQGKVLADYLTDNPTEGYQGSTTFTSLKVSGCDLYSAGLIHESDEVKGVAIFDSMHKHYKKVLLKEDHIV